MNDPHTQAVTREFYHRVSTAAAGTPYLVTPTEDGFDVALDIVDAQWIGILSAAGVKRRFVHHVKVTGPKDFTVEDDSQSVEWGADGPRLGGSVERQLGRQIQFGAEKSWGIRPNGSVGVITEYQFNSEEGRQLVTLVGEQMGLKQHMPTTAKIGLYVGIGTVVLLALAGIVVLILWLTGNLG